MPTPEAWTTGHVTASVAVAGDVRMVEIRPDDGARRWSPGSHLRLTVDTGKRRETRHYSLVGGSAPDVYRIAVRLRPNGLGGSRAVHAWQVGDAVRMTHPANHFELHHGAAQYLLVAAGIGVTPLVQMATTLRNRGADYRLLYTGRDESSMPFLASLRGEHGDRLEVHTSAADGRLDLGERFAGLDPRAEVYLCGPIGLRQHAQRRWREAGRHPATLRFETFASSGAYPAESFTVRVADIGVSVEVGERASMLDALRDAGVEVMWDCLRGECGLCALDVVAADGVLDHRDAYLSDAQREAGRKICTCVSRVVGGSVTVDSARRPDRTRVTTGRSPS